MMEARVARIARVEAEPLGVPLVDPFVIATARVEATLSALVTVTLASGEVGLGEAAALPPVTREGPGEVLEAVRRAAPSLAGLTVEPTRAGLLAVTPFLDALFVDLPVARAGVECALLDAVARFAALPARALLGGERGAATTTLVTDVTIPILERDRMVALARQWRQKGFSCFKVKVGKNIDQDVAALGAVHEAVPDATFRVDANGGYSPAEAVELARAVARAGAVVECWEQPCASLEAMAEATAALEAPVVADESVKTLADLARVAAARAARGVNLKIVKSGGPLRALAIGEEARRLGMTVMVGGMVETRLGMTAAAHLAAALGGVEYPDLDTAWLLAEDPFSGGYDSDGPRYVLAGNGFGVSRRTGGGA
jgi:L-alanine-DL-glutamate epimerase-like enolase superfamily enzyme